MNGMSLGQAVASSLLVHVSSGVHENSLVALHITDFIFQCRFHMYTCRARWLWAEPAEFRDPSFLLQSRVSAD
jgi:hypothetical protein